MRQNNVMIIAEIGGNHEGSFDYACKLLKLASESGADVVKFQIYTGASLVNKKEDPQRVAHFNKFALSTEEYLDLAKRAVDLGIEFNASIWDPSQIETFDSYLSFYKIGSGDLTAYSLLKEICSTNKPIILSTGLANIEEVKATIDFVCSQNGLYSQKDMISILQCTAMYPIPDQDTNLNVMHTLKDNFHDYKVGYSDHTDGTYAAEIAVAMGAEILELHFTDNKIGREFRDHKVSFTKDDMLQLREKINKIKTLQGSYIKKPCQSEIESGHVKSFRRAVYPARAIKAGETITDSDLISLRPNHGLSADKLEWIVGKKATRDLLELEEVNAKDFSA